MDKTSQVLSVFFEEPFWIGFFERTADGNLSVCKVTFGAKPTDTQVYLFILEKYDRLPFSPAIFSETKPDRTNPKRAKREAQKQMQTFGIGTKSQIALNRQREERKTERKTVGKEKREAEEQRKFMLKQQKRKEKHRGR